MTTAWTTFARVTFVIAAFGVSLAGTAMAGGGYGNSSYRYCAPARPYSRYYGYYPSPYYRNYRLSPYGYGSGNTSVPRNYPQPPFAMIPSAPGYSQYMRSYNPGPESGPDGPAFRPMRSEEEGDIHEGHGDQPDQPPIERSAKPGPSAAFTCPMHPEIKQEGPGNCPECGMHLVPSK
jgi:hypothetical protein